MNTSLWRMAFRNLSRNKRRNLATASAVAFGVAGLLSLLAYMYREENVRRVFTVYTSHIAHLVIYKKDGFRHRDAEPERNSLSPEEVTKVKEVLRGVGNIDFHGALILGQGLISNSCESTQFVGLGIEPEVEHRLRGHPNLLKWAPSSAPYLKGQGLWEFPGDFSGVILSSGLAHILHKERVLKDNPPDQALAFIDCKASDATAKISRDSNVQLSAPGWNGAVNLQDADVIAHLSTGNSQTNSSFLVAPLSYMQSLYGTTHVTNYSVWVQDESRLEATKTELSDKLSAAGLALEVHSFTEEQIAPFYSGTLGFIHIVVAFVGSVMTMVVIFSVFNAASITAMERSQEIGMMRSLGYTRRRIRMLFLMEAAVLTLASIAVGFVLGLLLNFSLNHAGIVYAPPGMDILGGILTLVLDPPAALFTWALIFAVSILTTLLSVWAVAKMPIATLLSGSSR